MGDRYNLRSSKPTPAKRSKSRDLYAKIRHVLQLQWLKSQTSGEDIPENIKTEIDKLAEDTVTRGMDKIDSQTLEKLGETLAEVVRGWQQQQISDQDQIPPTNSPAEIINQNIDDPQKINALFEEAVKEVIAASKNEPPIGRASILTYNNDTTDDESEGDDFGTNDPQEDSSTIEKLQKELSRANDLMTKIKMENKDLRMVAGRSVKEQHELIDENEKLHSALKSVETNSIAQKQQNEELRFQVSQLQKDLKSAQQNNIGEYQDQISQL